MAAFRSEADGGKIKPPNYTSVDYQDPDKIYEIARCMVDPIYFIENYCYVVHPMRGRVLLKLYEYQKRMVRAYVANDRLITMSSRQSGKSTIAAAFLLWFCIFQEDQKVLVASNKGRGAQEIMERFRFMYEECPWFIKPGIVVWNVMSVKFDNNSFIEGTTTTENTGRGLSLSCVALSTKITVRDIETRVTEEIEISELLSRIRVRDYERNKRQEIHREAKWGLRSIVSWFWNSSFESNQEVRTESFLSKDFGSMSESRNLSRSRNIPYQIGRPTEQGSREDQEDCRKASRHETLGRDACEAIGRSYRGKVLRELRGPSDLLQTGRLSPGIHEKITFEMSDDRKIVWQSKYEVLTPTGFRPFDGVLLSRDKSTLDITVGREHITCTQNHVLISNGKAIRADELVVGSLVETSSGPMRVNEISVGSNQTVVDLLNVGEHHLYYTNGLVSRNCLYLDEFAKVRPSIQQAFYTSTLPTLSTGGRLIITSTPDTDEDSFARIWFTAEDYDDSYGWTDETISQGEVEEAYETIYEAIESQSTSDAHVEPIEGEELNYGFKRIFVHWAEHPDRDEKFKQKIMLEGFTETDWLREFECRFYSAEATLIDPIKLLQLNAGARKPRFVDRYGMEWYEEIRPNVVHAIVIDPSEGVGRDQAVVQVWSLPDLRQVAEWASAKADQIEQTRMLIRAMKRIYDAQDADRDHVGEPEIYYSVETNGLGIGIINAIVLEGEERFPGYLVDASSNPGRGLKTTASTKLQFVMQLKKLIERGRFRPRSKALVSELKDFVRIGRGYEAKHGSKDDRVMSCVIMLHLLDELKYQVDDLEENMHVQLASEERDEEEDSDDQPIVPIF